MSVVSIITFSILEKILNIYYNLYIKNITLDDSLHPFFAKHCTSLFPIPGWELLISYWGIGRGRERLEDTIVNKRRLKLGNHLIKWLNRTKQSLWRRSNKKNLRVKYTEVNIWFVRVYRLLKRRFRNDASDDLCVDWTDIKGSKESLHSTTQQFEKSLAFGLLFPSEDNFQ